MRYIFLITAALLAGCASHRPEPALRPTAIAEGNYGVILERQIAGMEASAPPVWSDFRIGADTRGAHTGETFSAACAYLIRRDPTVFLRRHLAGDRYGILCGRRGYGWSGKSYQRVLDAVYRYRLLEAKSPAERQKIEQFVSETTKSE